MLPQNTELALGYAKASAIVAGEMQFLWTEGSTCLIFTRVRLCEKVLHVSSFYKPVSNFIHYEI